MPVQKKHHLDVIQEHLDLPGAKALDIGCGNGALARRLCSMGAWVVGLEVSPGQLRRAREAQETATPCYVLGFGESLPFGTESFDFVLFFNALHHIPIDVQEDALAEAKRVLKKSGRIYIAEPVAEGSNFEASREVEDETAVRAAAQAAIAKAARNGELGLALDERYLVERRFGTFEDFCTEMIAVDEKRKAVFARKGADIRDAFFRHAKQDARGYSLEQPMRLAILERTS